MPVEHDLSGEGEGGGSRIGEGGGDVTKKEWELFSLGSYLGESLVDVSGRVDASSKPRLGNDRINFGLGFSFGSENGQFDRFVNAGALSYTQKDTPTGTVQELCCDMPTGPVGPYVCADSNGGTRIGIYVAPIPEMVKVRVGIRMGNAAPSDALVTLEGELGAEAAAEAHADMSLRIGKGSILATRVFVDSLTRAMIQGYAGKFPTGE